MSTPCGCAVFNMVLCATRFISSSVTLSAAEKHPLTAKLPVLACVGRLYIQGYFRFDGDLEGEAGGGGGCFSGEGWGLGKFAVVEKEDRGFSAAGSSSLNNPSINGPSPTKKKTFEEIL